MIQYYKSYFGISLLLRVNGSAIYRSTIPGIISVWISLLVRWTTNTTYEVSLVDHPYAVGVLVATLTFLLVFRVQQGYARYWEACGAVHQMMSKWMDATIHIAVYHLQSSHYDHIRPPAFYDYPQLNQFFLTRDREQTKYSAAAAAAAAAALGLGGACTGCSNVASCHHHKATASSTKMTADEQINDNKNRRARRLHQRATVKSIELVSKPQKPQISSDEFGVSSDDDDGEYDDDDEFDDDDDANHPVHSHAENGNAGVKKSAAVPSKEPEQPCCACALPRRLEGAPRTDGNWGNLFKDQKSTYENPRDKEQRDPRGFAGIQGGRTPPLFLQELAHLCSLLTGVALATLRNDIEGAESPLEVFEAGSPWPAVDPDQVDALEAHGFRWTWTQRLRWFLGTARSFEERTHYNASRPLPVLGGVSDGEIAALQRARGPYAKTQLCWAWLSEFVIREHLAGSTGAVGPPIISRTIQFLGDGMIYYNHARKIMFIPFPFPHAQLSAFYVLVAIPLIPLLMDQFTGELGLACALTFLTVVCLSAIHEVARELENPFRNIPNELPLVTLQAQFNEALITMYSGFHPDHFWKDEADMYSQAASSFEKETAKKQETNAAASAGGESAKAEESTKMQETIHKLMEQMEKQTLEMEKHKLAMEQQQLRADRQKLELDRQQFEIDQLRAQLSKKSSETVKAD